MLTHHTLDTLRSLKLHGMATALEEQQGSPPSQELSFVGRHPSV